MLWAKRLVCGIVALLIGGIGFYLITINTQIWQAIGFCLFIIGLALGYIAITQKLPKYNFSSRPNLILQAARVIFLVTNVSPRLGDS